MSGLPVALTKKLWLAGLGPPCVAEKLRDVGLTFNWFDTPDVMLSVTRTETGELEAPFAAMEIAVRYAPGGRPVVLAETATVPGVTPVVGVAVSHEASSFTVKLSGPPVLVIESDCGAGLDPPDTAWNVSIAGFTTRD